ncbi:entericidin A/B family lipoprotein [uncultured Paraglaciecola sp.]|nr:entericidin A/B family lipoprotein [uncultured Paraglaciecola sp.]
MNTLKSKIRSMLIIMAIGAFLNACATVEGFGEDIETAGQAVQDAADN